jgi:hypothetical protein
VPELVDDDSHAKDIDADPLEITNG